MLKKILSLLLVAALLTFFAACSDKDSTTSTDSSSAVSAASSTTSSAASTASVTSSEASSDTPSGALKGVVDGVYYGSGYNVKVPKGYTLQLESELMAIFVAENNESLSIISSPNPTGETSVTEEDMKELLSTQFTGYTVEDFKTVKIDGKDAYTCRMTMELANTKVYTYTAMIPTSERIIVAAMGFANQNKASVFQETIDSLKID